VIEITSKASLMINEKFVFLITNGDVFKYVAFILQWKCSLYVMCNFHLCILTRTHSSTGTYFEIHTHSPVFVRYMYLLSHTNTRINIIQIQVTKLNYKSNCY